MATIFSKIVAGEIPSYKVAENDEFYAFLDIAPLAKGHTLVIPKREVDYIFDLEDDELGRMHIFAKHVANAIKEAFPCIKVGVAVLQNLNSQPMNSRKLQQRLLARCNTRLQVRIKSKSKDEDIPKFKRGISSSLIQDRNELRII